MKDLCLVIKMDWSSSQKFLSKILTLEKWIKSVRKASFVLMEDHLQSYRVLALLALSVEFLKEFMCLLEHLLIKKILSREPWIKWDMWLLCVVMVQMMLDHWRVPQLALQYWIRRHHSKSELMNEKLEKLEENQRKSKRKFYQDFISHCLVKDFRIWWRIRSCICKSIWSNKDV